MSWRGGARRALPYVIAGLGGFLTAYFVVATAIFPAGLLPAEIQVPNVTGLSFDQADAKLKALGLVAELGPSRVSATAPRRTVLEQVPPAGNHEPRGSKVVLIVSSGPQMAVVPMVIGMPRTQAEAVLEAAGFLVGEVTERAGNAPRGQVTWTMPAGNARATLPGPINIVVSAGPSTIAVPDVVGRDLDQARLLLEQIGLRVSQIESDINATAPDNTVVGQDPAAGTSVAAGSGVLLRVSAQRQ